MRGSCPRAYPFPCSCSSSSCARARMITLGFFLDPVAADDSTAVRGPGPRSAAHIRVAIAQAAQAASSLGRLELLPRHRGTRRLPGCVPLLLERAPREGPKRQNHGSSFVQCYFSRYRLVELPTYRDGSRGPESAPRRLEWPPESPRTAQESLKTAGEVPKKPTIVPGQTPERPKRGNIHRQFDPVARERPHGGPRGLREPPRGFQEAPHSRPNRPQEGLQQAPEKPPTTSQRTSKMPPVPPRTIATEHAGLARRRDLPQAAGNPGSFRSPPCA